jgi:hypothetical protein
VCVAKSYLKSILRVGKSDDPSIKSQSQVALQKPSASTNVRFTAGLRIFMDFEHDDSLAIRVESYTRERDSLSELM